MSNIIKARVQIQGIRPLLQNHWGPNAIPLEKLEKQGVAGNDPNEWRKTCMVTPKGQLFVEGRYIFGMFGEAAYYTKKGKGSIRPAMMATLQVEDKVVLLDRWMPKKGDPGTDPEQPVYIDVCHVVNPTSHKGNTRYRLAASPGWKAEFTLLWDKTVVSREQMKAVAIDAGKLVGLADGRKIGNGRFTVEKFEVFDDAEATAPSGSLEDKHPARNLAKRRKAVRSVQAAAQIA